MHFANIDPWARPPLELILHANEHLQKERDVDRKLALIGFDNAIEVTIDVFLSLHPTLRGGVEISRRDVENASNNYYSKIEFLEKYVKLNKLLFPEKFQNILCYHSVRNAAYHSGLAMVPEKQILIGVRAAAIAVFELLFQTKISHHFYDLYIPFPSLDHQLVLRELVKNGAISILVDRYRPNVYEFLVKMPDNRVGTVIVKYDDFDKKARVITRFVFGKKYNLENNNDKEKLLKKMNIRGRVEIIEPLPFQIADIAC